MTSVKVKFRASKVEGKEGVIYYQVIHERVIRQIKSAYRIYSEEWDECSLEVVCPNIASLELLIFQLLRGV